MKRKTSIDQMTDIDQIIKKIEEMTPAEANVTFDELAYRDGLIYVKGYDFDFEDEVDGAEFYFIHYDPEWDYNYGKLKAPEEIRLRDQVHVLYDRLGSKEFTMLLRSLEQRLGYVTFEGVDEEYLNDVDDETYRILVRSTRDEYYEEDDY